MSEKLSELIARPVAGGDNLPGYLASRVRALGQEWAAGFAGCSGGTLSGRLGRGLSLVKGGGKVDHVGGSAG